MAALVCDHAAPPPSSPAPSPLRYKQHCVCHLSFRERPFRDRPRSVPVSTRKLFCFLLRDEESRPFSLNKQTVVWINKLEGCGCGPVRTVRSVRPVLRLGTVSARSRLYWSESSTKWSLPRKQSIVQQQNYFRSNICLQLFFFFFVSLQLLFCSVSVMMVMMIFLYWSPPMGGIWVS